VEHPDFEREVRIVALRAPGVPEELARQVARAAQKLRAMGLYKPPGIAETLDWAEALAVLGRSSLDEASVDATLGAVLKYREDQQKVRTAGLEQLFGAVGHTL
jgi:MoxR-like ATPase